MNIEPGSDWRKIDTGSYRKHWVSTKISNRLQITSKSTKHRKADLKQIGRDVSKNSHQRDKFLCRPPVVRVSDKVMIPQEEYPDINFVGLLIGPRGNTLKTLEKEVKNNLGKS